jgi:hypothetical protein
VGEDAVLVQTRLAKVWAWIAEETGDDAPVSVAASVAALCRAAQRRLGVDGVSVTVMSGPGVHDPVSASDALAARLEELQLTLGEGPCVEAFAFDPPMLIPDLETTVARWPGFVPAAVSAGARAMFALPLHSGAIRLGVLALYRVLPGSLAPEELADVLVFADLALQLLLDAPSGLTGQPGYHPMDGVSTGRAQVYQASGMISVQLAVSIDEAFVCLRANAFAAGRPLGEVAHDVVARRLRFTRDPGKG